MKLLAHISDDKTRTQTIEEHLTSTAALAGNFAAAFGAQAEAAYTALLHDIGKYSAGFQQRLQGGPPVDHSTAGAKAAIQDGNIPAALAIAGHHSQGRYYLTKSKREVEFYARQAQALLERA